MKLIVISRPDFFEGEGELINELFRLGMECLHLRKPGANLHELRSLIRSIDLAFLPFVSVHEFHQIADEYHIKRWHFTEQQRLSTDIKDLYELKAKGHILSTSVHDPADLAKLKDCFDYAFLSPVFDSISKENYKGIVPDNFCPKETNKLVKAIALGGINHQNINTIKGINFDGAAVLGTIWNEPRNAIKNFNAIRNELNISNSKSQDLP